MKTIFGGKEHPSFPIHNGSGRCGVGYFLESAYNSGCKESDPNNPQRFFCSNCCCLV